MFPLNMPERQYVLSLDKLDLSFLSQYVQKPDKKRTLWSKPFMDGESVYCEVQIESDEFDDDDSFYEPSVSFTCHICNIDVPEKFYKQHVNSRLHQTYKKISEKVLENVSKQMSINIDSVNSEECDEFYCETCSKAVLMEHKQKHSRSKYHLKYLSNQVLATNFVEMYIENNDIEKEIENENKKFVNDNKSNIECNSDSDTDWNFDSDNEDDTKYNEVIAINNIITINDTTETQNISDNECEQQENSSTDVKPDTSHVSSEITYFELYLWDIKSKYQLEFNMPFLDYDSILIITPDSTTDRVTVDNFHSYKKLNDANYCQFCKIYVGEFKSIHNMSEHHARSITQRVNNYFGRELIDNEEWSHCVLCNNIVRTGALHYNMYHKRKHVTNYSSYNNPNDSEPPNKIFCEVCNSVININDWSSHFSRIWHLSKLKALNKANPDIVSHDNVTLPQNTDSGICSIDLVNNINIAEVRNSQENRHVNSVNKEQIELKKSTVVENKIRNEANLPSTSRPESVAHASQVHRVPELTKEEKVTEYYKQMAEFNQFSVQCLVCDLKVPFTDHNVIEHVEGYRHRTAVALLLQENKVERLTADSYNCKLCDVTFDDFVDHIQKDFLHRCIKGLKSMLSKRI